MFAPGTFAQFYLQRICNSKVCEIWPKKLWLLLFHLIPSKQTSKGKGRSVFLFSLCFSCQDNMATCDGLLLFGVELS